MLRQQLNLPRLGCPMRLGTVAIGTAYVAPAYVLFSAGAFELPQPRLSVWMNGLLKFENEQLFQESPGI